MSTGKTFCILSVLLALASCSADPRPLTEAADAANIGLEKLEIESEFEQTESIVINSGEIIQFSFKAVGAAGETLALDNIDRRWYVTEDNGSSSDGTDKATIDGTGRLVALKTGAVRIGLRFASVSAVERSVRISDAEFTAIVRVEGPDDPSELIECSRSEPYTAIGSYEGEGNRRLRNVEWSLGQGQGLVGKLLINEPDNAVVGSATVGSIELVATAALPSGDSVNFPQLITVMAGLDDLTLLPAMSTEVELTATIRLSASAMYTADSMMEEDTVTDLVQWSAADESIASVSNETDSEGVLTGISVGETTVTARCGEQTQTLQVSVVNPTSFSQLLISPDGDPDPVELTLNGSTQQLTITATSAAGARIDVTNLAVYQVTSGEDVVSVDSAGTTRGEVTPLKVGTATINVEYRGVENNLNVRVR